MAEAKSWSWAVRARALCSAADWVSSNWNSLREGVSTGAEATQRIAAKKPSQSPGEGEGGGEWVSQVSDSEIVWENYWRIVSDYLYHIGFQLSRWRPLPAAEVETSSCRGEGLDADPKEESEGTSERLPERVEAD